MSEGEELSEQLEGNGETETKDECGYSARWCDFCKEVHTIGLHDRD